MSARISVLGKNSALNARILIAIFRGEKMPEKPDLANRPYSCTVEVELVVSPAVVYKAWTEQFDRWFAASGTLQMKAEVDTPFFFETHFDGGRHPHYGRILSLEPDRLVEMTWVTGNPGTGGAETVIRLEIEAQNDGSKVTLVHSGFADQQTCDGHADAWPLAFTHLDECMKGQG